MEQQSRWPRYLIYAVQGMQMHPIEEDAYLSAFAQRWGGIDRSALAQALAEGAGDDRLVAIRALGHHSSHNSDPSASDLLLPFLESVDPVERWESATQLAIAGRLDAISVLGSLLVDTISVSLDDYLADGPSAFDDLRPGTPLMLAKLGGERAVPFLRRALLRLVTLLGQSSAFPEAEVLVPEHLPRHIDDLSRSKRGHIHEAFCPGRRRFLGPNGATVTPKDAIGWREAGGSTAGFLANLLSNVDELVYALGVLGAFGALTGVGAPVVYLYLWTMQLVMGYMRDHVDSAILRAAVRGDGALRELAAPLLQRYFGLDEDEASRAVTLYTIVKAHSLAEQLARGERRRTQDGGISDADE